jgi:hypothetical protein
LEGIADERWFVWREGQPLNGGDKKREIKNREDCMSVVGEK